MLLFIKDMLSICVTHTHCRGACRRYIDSEQIIISTGGRAFINILLINNTHY